MYLAEEKALHLWLVVEIQADGGKTKCKAFVQMPPEKKAVSCRQTVFDSTFCINCAAYINEYFFNIITENPIAFRYVALHVFAPVV